MVRIRLKDSSGKELVDSKAGDDVELRFSRKPKGGAVQVVWNKEHGMVVHIHCKVCGNQWKVKESDAPTAKFTIHGASGVLRIECKNCGRTYLSG